MSATPQKTDDNQEIDLRQISKSIGNFFEGISDNIFGIILFLKKNLLVLISLFITGVVAGYFIDKVNQSYRHDIIVSSNFASNDYLYNKVGLINASLTQKDTVFFNKIGISNFDKINAISIKPIIDIYSLVNNAEAKTANNAQNTQNFELVKLLSEDGDITKVIKDSVTSRNYTSHKISIVTDNRIDNDKTITPLLNYLNKSDYYNKYQSIYISNINEKIKQDTIVIKQIDNLLNQFATNNNQKNDKLIYYNENNQLNDLINNKNARIDEIGYLRTQLTTIDKIVKDTSITINIKNNKGLNNKMKLVLPLLLIFGYIGFIIFGNYYRKQLAKQNS
ncbi:MAG: hypothetical protein H7239_09615 [Flavobacterium sp.]|nr:hypothetical protein [Flavobacterium sp.]